MSTSQSDSSQCDNGAASEAVWRPLTETLQARLAASGYRTHIMLSAVDPHRWQTTFRITIMGNGKLQCEIERLCTPWMDSGTRAACIEELGERGWKYIKSHNTFKIQRLKNEAAEFMDAIIAVLRDDLGVVGPTDVELDASGAGLFPSRRESLSVEDTLDLRREDICAVPEDACDTVRRLNHIDLHIPVMGATRRFNIDFGRPPYESDPHDENNALPIAFVPNDANQLMALACSTLSRVTGLPIHDVSKGMPFLPFPGPHVSRLFVARGDTQLVFCMPLAHDFRDPSLLGAAVLSYSSTWPSINLIIAGDHLYAIRIVDCKVFHRANMQVAVQEWFDFCTQAASSLAEMMNPDGNGPGMCMPVALPEGLQGLMEADAKAPSGLKPNRVFDRPSLSATQATAYRRLCRHLAHEWSSEAAPESLTSRSDHVAATAFFARIADLLDAALPLTRRRYMPDDPFSPDGPYSQIDYPA